MINPLRRFAIGTHVIIITSIVVGLFAAVSAGYFSSRYNRQTRASLEQKAGSISKILATNVSAGLLFGDSQTVVKLLAGAKLDPTIEAILVMDQNDKLFVSYVSPSAPGGAAAMTAEAVAALGAEAEAADPSGRYLYTQEPVLHQNDTIGRLVLVSSTALARKDLADTVRSTGIVFILIYAVSVLLTLLLARSLSAPIRQAADIAHRISTGNLEVPPLAEDGDDEISKMSAAINIMVGSLKDMLAQINQSNQSINRTIADLQTSTVQQRHGLENQATAISEISTTINELKTTSRQSAAVSQRVLDDAERSVEVSKQGLSSNEKAVGGMNQINEQMETIAETILSLSERSQQIVDIVATVNDLAQQSNYLALNASIEAAKAGEHGKGFAVVAMEVRNLAEQSQRATGQIRAILNEIQSTMNSAVLVTENGTAKVKEGVSLIRSVGEVIKQLSDVVTEGASSARQIAASSNQQSLGMDQIAQAINAISQTMNETTASAKQLESAADGLVEVGSLMSRTIENLSAGSDKGTE